jgi:hypothetical protein
MLSSHLSGPVQVPVRPTNVIDGRAALSVRAVQAVAIEEHQVRHGRAIERFVHAKKVLDRCSGAAFRLWVQTAHTNDAWYNVSVAADGPLARRLLRRLRLSSRLGGGPLGGRPLALPARWLRHRSGSFAGL